MATNKLANAQVMALKFNSFIVLNIIDTVKVPRRALNERYAIYGAGLTSYDNPISSNLNAPS